MCYSAQIRAEYKKYVRRWGADVSLKDYFQLYWDRRANAKIKIPRVTDAEFANPANDDERKIKELIDEFNTQQATKFEQELFKQRKRLVDAERTLQTKTTKKATEDKRIATDKIEWAKDKLARLRSTVLDAEDARIFPGWYAPVMIVEDGKYVVNPIINHAENLFSRTPRMQSLGASRGFTEEPEWRHGARAFDVISGHFLPTLQRLGIPIGDAAILAPDWFTLFPLGKLLRAAKVPIVGPGARPYRRGQFALIAEAVCGYLIDPRSEGIIGIERSLFNTLLDMTGRANFDIFSYRGRTIVFRLIGIAKKLQAANASAVAWLKAAAYAFAEVLIAEEYPKENFGNNTVHMPVRVCYEWGNSESKDFSSEFRAFVGAGPSDGVIDIDDTVDVTIEEFHLQFNPRFQEYSYSKSSHALVIIGTSEKMSGGYP